MIGNYPPAGTGASDRRRTPGQSDPQVKRMLRSESRLWSGYALPPPDLRPLRIIDADRSR